MLTIIFDKHCENIIDSVIESILKDGYKPLSGSDSIDFKIKIIKIYIKLLNDSKVYTFDDIIKLFDGDKFNKNKIITTSSIIFSAVYKPHISIEIQHYLTFNFVK